MPSLLWSYYVQPFRKDLQLEFPPGCSGLRARLRQLRWLWKCRFDPWPTIAAEDPVLAKLLLRFSPHAARIHKKRKTQKKKKSSFTLGFSWWPGG